MLLIIEFRVCRYTRHTHASVHCEIPPLVIVECVAINYNGGTSVVRLVSIYFFALWEGGGGGNLEPPSGLPWDNDC